MNKNITQNDLLLLAYNEFPPKKHKELMDRVLKNEKWAKEFDKIQKQMDVLDTLFENPSPTSVNIVLEESCSFNHLETI